MAPFSLSFKVYLISAGVLFMALLLKVSVPLVADFSVHQAPLLWRSLLPCLRPPYLYLILNCIIITIAASSMLHHNNHERIEQEQVPSSQISMESVSRVDSDRFKYEMKMETRSEFEDVEYSEEEVESGDDGGDLVEAEVESGDLVEATENLVEMEALAQADKPPLVSGRFGHGEPKGLETLEDAWKMITKSRTLMALRDKFERNTGQQVNVNGQVDSSLLMKSETLKNRTNLQLPLVTGARAMAKVRREASMTQEELNRRVEAFIEKVNEEMRKQRQESLNQYN